MSNLTIAIAGASASGKSLFTQTLFSELSEDFCNATLAILEEDCYYQKQSHLPFESREKINYDHPNAFEHTLLLEHLKALKNGGAVEVPIYDFEQHDRSDQTRQVVARDTLIVEGILLLNDPKLREQFDIKIFIDTPLDVCLLRRIDRDMRERGRTYASVAEQYMSTVRPMYYEFIEPSKKYADIIVTGGGKNRVALDLVKDSIRSNLKR
ncbi:MAG: uridine kinase [Acidiferrobacterales bacterium]|nr:uridine kinase [Acidiferrobacterales bacterium]